MGRLPNQKLVPGRPAKPLGMDPKVAAEWERIMDELVESNIVLCKAHRSLVESAAYTAVEIADALEVITLEGRYVVNDKTGVCQAHPAARRLDSLRRDYVKTMSLLGMRSAHQGTDAVRKGSDLTDD